ncbi:YpmA family protein [Desulfitibacter alkalitolerans]|uniref:YpmA family protein n=1 Tax=Desulfitibacter alkalitolerans TaxID=264641 RepID=UPI000AA99242|nr:YpmA family protein [Desulfitibacter alkalitolerans]
MESNDKLTIIASITIQESEDFYKIVDFLNRTLKERGLLFGLKKVKNEPKMTLYIYDV